MHVHWAAVVTAVSALLIAVVGWFVGSSFRTQTRAHLYEKRLDAYATMWQLLGQLPVPPKGAPDNDPASDDCVRIGQAFTAWYYADGYGMFLTDPTRNMWLAVRDSLRAGGEQPVTLSRQASLLRTQLKADLEVYYGRHVSGERLRTHEEIAFLRSTALKPKLFDELPPGVRRLMWLRYNVLRWDEPVLRTRALWRSVIAQGLEPGSGIHLGER